MKNGPTRITLTSSTSINILCAMLGLGVFLFIYGYKILDPTFIEWTLKGDSAIHYLGWHFFRSEPWSFPLGALKSYMYPQGTSVVFTDSIPLLAIPLKLLSPLLPTTFQYHGLWLLIVYMLQGAFGAKLMRQVTTNVAFILIGVLFFLLSPTVTSKAFKHEALTGHWIILASLYLYLRPEKSVNRLKWLLLLAIASLVHFYLLFMAGVLWGAYIFRLRLEGIAAKNLLFTILLTIFVTIITMWLAGYFVIDIKTASADGFGKESMNLASPFFPSSYFPFTFGKAMPYADKWQHEGFNYLGMGTLLMIILSIYVQLGHQLILDMKKHLPLLITSFVLLVIAISNKITWSDSVLYEIQLPYVAEKILGIIRASGRMFWPIGYLLVLCSMAVIIKYYSVQRAFYTLFLLLVIQIIDFWPWYKNLNFATRYTFQSPLCSPKWEAIINKVDHVAIIPPRRNDDEYLPFALLAANYKKTINVGPTARANMSSITIEKETTEFNNGILQNNTLYIINDSSLYNQPARIKARYETLDGYHIAITAH